MQSQLFTKKFGVVQQWVLIPVFRTLYKAKRHRKMPFALNQLQHEKKDEVYIPTSFNPVNILMLYMHKTPLVN